MTSELTTPRCRLEEVDAQTGAFISLLWEVNELPKFWRPQRDDVISLEEVEYEVKDIVVEFEVQEERMVEYNLDIVLTRNLN